MSLDAMPSDVMPSDAMPPDTTSLRIARKEQIARDIYLFELRDPGGSELPPFTAGAHVKLLTPSGLVRKYSLCNAPIDRHFYLVAVKREIAGRGGSIDLIDRAQVNDTLAVSPPVNDFELPPRATDFLFIAGGIGITPIMAMIRALQGEPDKRFRLYYCTGDPEATAFLEELTAPDLKGSVRIHHDGGDLACALDLWPLLEERKNRQHLYCCGPRPLMETVRELTGHWSSAAVHFEAFEEPKKITPNDTPFLLTLARTGTELVVPVGQTILETMLAHGIDAPHSCESGTCGTCRTKLLQGKADHRDLVLTEHERDGQIMMCVSRARSPKLVIDR
jgi:phthalate 4,5-dioxygenase reductase subunit